MELLAISTAIVHRRSSSQKCRIDIATSETHIRELFADKLRVEKQNGYIDLVDKACTFAQVSIFAFDALLFLSGHWIWGFLMNVGGNVPVSEGIRELEKSLLSGKYKQDTHGYDRQIAIEHEYIDAIEKNIKLAEDMIKSSVSSDGVHNSQNNAGGKSNSGGETRNGRNKSAYQHNVNCAICINDCYAFLCCSPDASINEVQTAYKKLVKEYHPDRVRATGLGEHITRDAEEKLKQINEAYHKIMESRGKR